VSGYEYCFSEDGICKCPPKSAPAPAKFKECLVLGLHTGSANDVSRVLKELRSEFPPGSYDLLAKNCNAFSNALSLRLVGVEVGRVPGRLIVYSEGSRRGLAQKLLSALALDPCS
jgi:hypothetical protein